MLAAEWTVWQVFWSLLWITAFGIWIYLAFVAFADIFRSRDQSGWAKALWVAGIVLFPLIGVLVYVAARDEAMARRKLARSGSSTYWPGDPRLAP